MLESEWNISGQEKILKAGQLHYCISGDDSSFALLILLIEIFTFLLIVYSFTLGK